MFPMEKQGSENTVLSSQCSDLKILHTENILPHKPPKENTGFIQKNPFKIHKHFTKLCKMVRKSNMKVHKLFHTSGKGVQPLL